MAKRTQTANAHPRLFEQQERAHERRIRRQRALFIPRYLKEAAADKQLVGAAKDKAHAIVIRWADLETSGELAKHKETSIDTQFLDQVFGEGLGYALKTTSPTAWQLEHKYSVPMIGTADAALGTFQPRYHHPWSLNLKTQTPILIVTSPTVALPYANAGTI